MAVPQSLILLFYMYILLVSSHLHGRRCAGKVNFWVVLSIVVVNVVLLAIGGFFRGFLPGV